VRVYNHISWKELIAFDHTSTVSGEGMRDEIHIYKEEEYREGSSYNMDEKVTSRYKMQDLPIKLPTNKVAVTDKANPPIGIS
jgi:hypothetical protein